MRFNEMLAVWADASDTCTLVLRMSSLECHPLTIIKAT